MVHNAQLVVVSHPQQQEQINEANYKEMEKYGYSREKYDEIQKESSKLQQQKKMEK